MSTRIFLAGSESEAKFKSLMEMKAKSVLVSHWTIRKDPDFVKRHKDKYPNVDLIIDSGAYSLMVQKTTPTVSDCERYKDKYVKWINRNRDYIFAAVELDLDKVVGKSRVDQWREKIFRPLSEKVPIIFVFHHQVHPPEYWTYLCRTHPYIGIGSTQGGTLNAPLIKRMLNEARDYLAKVHGFGFTASTEIQDYSFYSIDSTTWLSSSMYGATLIFNGRTISSFSKDQKSERLKHRIKFLEAGLNMDLIKSDHHIEVGKMNQLAFIELEAHLQRAYSYRDVSALRLPADETEIHAMPDKDIWEYVTKRLRYQRTDYAEESDPTAAATEDLLQVSRLQNGIFDDFRDNFGEGWFSFAMDEYDGDQLAPDPLPEDDEGLQEWRLRLNRRLMETIRGEAKARKLEDYKPSFVILRRPPEDQEPEEGLSEQDLEGVDLFYGD